MCFTGKNRVTLTAFDERRYAFGVQLVRKRSQAEVRSHTAHWVVVGLIDGFSLWRACGHVVCYDECSLR